ncbi:MAG TPA: mannose-1-phosphate guanylyltransferase [Deltaproteobacteria bacterium]|nr:mannose-1-phosphate guanylyltransferase [Deltaproteobacteria bacterium]HPR50614.1 mannose-1-phosphate guanylyltransferase [Deltaproteobacteria bacterium]
MALHVVIMAGGKGERLWPLSTHNTPKQLLSFGLEKSLLRATVDRTAGLTDKEHVYVVTNTAIADKVHEQLPDLPRENILAEPIGRNTAPCIAYAAAMISLKDNNAVMAVFPSDHLVGDPEGFTRALRFALDALKTYPHLLITLGMVPDHPETGYGYIAPGEILFSDEGFKLYKVNTFHEKPGREKALEYMEEGCLWNAGMFLWRVDTILEEFRQHTPGMYDDLMALRASMKQGRDKIAAFYERVESVSIDYAVMEKTRNAATIPAEFGWNDIGSFDAIGKVLPPDGHANVVSGDVVLEESSGNVVFSSGKKIVVMDAKDLVVIEGEDAILVCPRDASQRISALVKKMVK